MSDKTWTYEPSDDAMATFRSFTFDHEPGGGSVVPITFVRQMTDIHGAPRWYMEPKTWEERLAAAIEYRSFRARRRRLVQRLHFRAARARIAMAWDVLRDRHECGDDDW